MNNFEDRKKAFLNGIDIDENRIKSMLEKKDPNTTAMVAILLNPRNEAELRAAQSIYTYLNDMEELALGIRFNNLKKVPVEENEGLKFITTIIKILKKDGELSEEFIKDIFVGDNQNNAVDYKKISKIIIDLLQFFNPSEEEIEYLVSESGIDFDNNYEVYALQASLERAEQEIQALDPTKNMSFTNLTEETITNFEAFATAFHEQITLRTKKDEYGFGSSKYLN